MIIRGGSWSAVAAALLSCGSRSALDLPAAQRFALDASGDVTHAMEASTHDGGALHDASVDAPAACRYRDPGCVQPLPAFDDRCVTASDCAIGFQGCCDQLSIGLSASRRSAFDTARSTWLAVCCATVDCAAQYVCSQQNRVCPSQGPTVACVAGECKTQCQ